MLTTTENARYLRITAIKDNVSDQAIRCYGIDEDIEKYDGILEQMTDDNLVNILSMDSTDEKKRDIIARVTEDNKDNHSAHIIRVLSVGERKEVPAPAVESETVGAPKPHKSRVSLIILAAVILTVILAIVL